MVPYDAFRQDLAGHLIGEAERRRRAARNGEAGRARRDDVGLLERLADDAKNLDLHVFLIFQLVLANPALARLFERRRDQLLAEIGTTRMPRDATDLVRWLAAAIVGHAAASDGRNSEGVEAPALPRVAVVRGSVRSGLGSHPIGLPRRARNRGWAIAATVLALWLLALGFGQWRDRARVETRAAVPARVVAVAAVGSGRSSGSTLDLLLEFQPSPAAAPCRLTTRVGFLSPSPRPGDAIPVVPRSAGCEPPIVPQRIGSPVPFVALAAILLALGLGWRGPQPGTSPLRRRGSIQISSFVLHSFLTLGGRNGLWGSPAELRHGGITGGDAGSG